MPKPDAIDRISKARMNAALRSEATEIILEQEESIINRALREYRSDRLSEMKALSLIAELSAIRELLETIESNLKRSDSGDLAHG